MKILLMTVLIGLLTAMGDVVAATVAVVQEATGIVSISKQGGKRIIVAQGTALDEGDTIYTERDSEARLRFTDGGQIALRPNSVLAIQSYRFVEPEPRKDSLVMSLLKGGLRNITGLIGKRGDRDAYRMNAVIATIGIRGTDFVVRLCETDCEVDQTLAEERKLKPRPVPVAARVASLAGQMTATSVGGVRRLLKFGSPVLEGELVETDAESHGALLFTDGGRLVLARGTHLVVNRYRFVPANVDDGGFLVQVVKGGVRLATGLLAKLKPDKVKVNTVTGVIGIRGTDFDLGCAAKDTPPEQIDPMKRVGESCDGALAVRMREGLVAMPEGPGELVIGAGETGYMSAPGQPPRKVDEGEKMDDWELPLPSEIDTDFAALAGPDGREQTQPGLYILVKEGRVVIIQDGKETELDPGDTGYLDMDGGTVQRLGVPPLFLDADTSVNEMDLDPMMCRAS